MDISDKLKQCRKQKNLTQKELAEKLHLSRKTISGWENGRGYPDIKSITILSDIFKISADDLLRDDNLLEHYAEQNKQSLRADKIVKITYYLNLALTILSYGTIFKLWKINNTIISLILLANTIIFLSNYTDWNSFKRNKKLLKATLIIVFLLFLNAIIIPLNMHFFKLIAIGSQPERLGVITGQLIVIILLSIGLTLALFFYPKKLSKIYDF